MTEFWVVTSGKGLLPAGRKVGYIAAGNEEEAESALIKSGQVSPRFAGHFRFEPKGSGQ